MDGKSWIKSSMMLLLLLLNGLESRAAELKFQLEPLTFPQVEQNEEQESDRILEWGFDITKRRFGYNLPFNEMSFGGLGFIR